MILIDRRMIYYLNEQKSHGVWRNFHPGAPSDYWGRKDENKDDLMICCYTMSPAPATLHILKYIFMYIIYIYTYIL